MAADWRVTGGVLKIARRICEVGVAGSPVIGRRWGAFLTLLRQSGLRASTGGVLATKSKRKMLASTCLYSLYAWFTHVMLNRNDVGPVDEFRWWWVSRRRQPAATTDTRRLRLDRLERQGLGNSRSSSTGSTIVVNVEDHVTRPRLWCRNGSATTLKLP